MTQAKELIRLASSPALSPDGKLLAFDWNGDIWTVPTGGGEAKQLTTDTGRDRQPRFSPDGKQIAFVSDRDGNPQVYVIPTTGGVPKQLTYHTSGSSVLEWTADGKELLVAGIRDYHWRHGERFFRISSSERGAEQLLFDDYGREGTLSPDGKKLLFTREGETWFRKGYQGSQASQVWLYDLEKKTFEKLIGEQQSSRSPLWRPDGKAFYFVGGDKNDSVLNEFDLTTKKTKELYRAKDELIVSPSLARDGSTLVFRQLFDFYALQPGEKPEAKKIVIERVGDGKPDRKEKRTLTTATKAAFTADALEIAIVAGGDLWVMDTELREPRQITTTGGFEHNPVFSADGETIFFLSDVEGKTDIWRAERADKTKFWWQNRQFKVTKVTSEGDLVSGPRFTPEGKLTYQRDRGDIWVADIDGKNARQLLKSWSMPEYDFSPDGKWLVYAQNDDDFNRDVWLLGLEEKDARPYNLSRHPNNEFQPVWSPDGHYLAYRGGRPSRDGDYIVSIVYLRSEDTEKNARDKALEKALEKMLKARKPGARPMDEKPVVKGTPTVVDMEGLQDRIRRVSLGTTGTATQLFWSPDSKKLGFTGAVSGTAGTYTIDVGEDTLTPRSLTTGTGSDPRWLKQGNVIAWVAAGVPSVLPGTGVSSSTTTSTQGNPLTGRTSPRGGGSTTPSSSDGST